MSMMKKEFPLFFYNSFCIGWNRISVSLLAYFFSGGLPSSFIESPPL